ncbi:MAG: alpha/beta hydrolase [Crocinitomicaceae bacterium]|nr:alpha/beta hydrolase [Crocinitomicaceae bacterium]
MATSALYHKLIPHNGQTDNPVLLIHGFLESHTMWYDIPLEKFNRPIVLIDVPGFGKSELLDDKKPSIHYFAEAIYELMELYQFSAFSIVGHSMGGYIGLELLQITDKAQKLLLLNSNFWQDSTLKQRDRIRVADILIQHKDAFIVEAIPNLFLNPANHASDIKKLVNEAKNGVGEWYAYASLAMKDRADFTNFLKNNPARFDIIQGKEDALIPLNTMMLNCEGWKTPYIIENSGHMSLYEQKDEVVKLLMELI